MRELRGKVAVVTGGGSGIGRGMAIAFADAGMDVAIADVEAPAGEKVAAEIESRGVRALAVPTDVSSGDSVMRLADTCFSKLGGVHVLCNNAGVAHFGPLLDNDHQDWAWTLSVNLQGVANGLLAFLPRMRGQGEGHVVNTASLAGLLPVPTLGIYAASKHGVVGLSETLRLELAGSGVSCSVLCPGVVNTAIFNAERNRPDSLGGPSSDTPPEAAALMAQGGKDPLEVGRMVRQGVIDDDLYIFSHPEAAAFVEARFEGIRAAFQKWSGWSDE